MSLHGFRTLLCRLRVGLRLGNGRSEPTTKPVVANENQLKLPYRPEQAGLCSEFVTVTFV